jgi:DNA repair protein RecO (recombination protein O)
MEWEAPGIILDVRPFGEGDAVATVMTEEHGAHRGLARGAQSRTRVALWQPGNLVQLRWVGRLADQLGALTAEMVHPTAAMVLDDALALGMLTSACSVAQGALPEREAQPRVFDLLLHLLARLPQGEAQLGALIRWEAALLAGLGYGLDLSRCAVTGTTENLAWISPKSGCAVSAEAGAQWESRLLRLPALLLDDSEGDAGQWVDGLRVTGHFLARDVFGLQNKPLPAARLALYDRVTNMATSRETETHSTDA